MELARRNSVSSFFFQIAYSLFLTYSLLGHVSFLHEPLKLATTGALAILAINFIIQYDKCSQREFFGYVFLMMVALGTSFTNGDYGLFKIILFAGSIRTLNYKDIIRFAMWLRLCLMLLVVALCTMGIIPDIIRTYEGTVRHSLGFTNPNALGTAAFILICDMLYISDMKVNFSRLLVVGGIFIWLYVVARCRTAAAAIAALSVVACIYTIKPQLFKHPLVKRLFCLMPIMLFVLTNFITMQYNHGNAWAIDLNKFLSGRIETISEFFSVLSPKLMGQPLSATFRNSLDNAYAFILLDLGVVITIIFIIAVIRLVCRNYDVGDIPLCIIMMAFLCYGLSEHLWINADYNLFVLALCYNPANKVRKRNFI